jgi:dTMP kinase
MFLVFSGTDGAGKSTQIDLIKSYYESEGRRVSHIWARGGYTPGFNLIKKVLRLLAGKRLPSSGVSDNREAMIKKQSVSNLWLTIAILDLILFYAIYTRFLQFMGRIVICDRYIEDTYLDFTYNFGDSFNSAGILWRVLVMLAPKSSKAFLLTVPVDVSITRSKLKNEPFPDVPETLAWRLKQYNDEAIFPSNKFYKIDCQSSVDFVQQKIRQQITRGV